MGFFDMLAEGMGWKKPNLVSNASQISDEQKQKWYDERAESARRAYEEEHGPLSYKIKDAKNRHGAMDLEDNPYGGDFQEDIGNNTRVFEFTYYAPIGDGDPNWTNRVERRTGRALLRTPTSTQSRSAVGIPHRYFDNDGSYDDGFAGEIGVYDAVLDDGTHLDADQLRDFIMNDRNRFKWSKEVTEKNAGNNHKEDIEKWEEYADSLFLPENPGFVGNYRQSQRGDNREIRWDPRRRMWMVQ